MPAKRSIVETASFTATGTTTDDVAVDQVRVGIFDRKVDKWLQSNGSWSNAYAFRVATLASPGAPTTDWSLALTLPTGKYAFDVKARDTSGNLTANSVWNPFEVRTPSADSTPPSSTVSSPEKNSTVDAGTVLIAGTSTDNVAVNQVRIAIYNRIDSSNRWLQPNGTFGPKYAFVTADLDSPGATSTTWNAGISLPAGLYGADVKAVDAIGNVDPNAPWTPFKVGDDTARPVAKVTKAEASGPKTLKRRVKVVGTAKDDSSVIAVQLSVKKLGAPRKKRFLQKNGSFGRKATLLRSTVVVPGMRSVRWNAKLRLPAGRYQVRVIPIDATRNKSKSPATKRFKVVTRR